ncbi:hypothetical protein [Spirochaeta lutea]|uniref:PEGA domain-containing protein n=1 Tax=Spirochaeta lutea TaxID=1480694 RepID=A0A098QWI6_9SPIO|nr:hypothetical protein [Spirochaeta lutea]KGE70807.1 hypothetical protein DC28_15080 [Spirochaeta lutea]
MKRTMLIILVVLLLGTGCVSTTMVRFETNAGDATITVEGKEIQEHEGIRLSNAAWKNPDIMVEAEGYKTYYGEVEREIKVANAIFGALLWPFSWLYVWGPEAHQFIVLRELD